MFDVDSFPLDWEKDLQGVTDIHLSKYQNVVKVTLRRYGQLEHADWLELVPNMLWQWAMWHGGLLQLNLRKPQHSIIRLRKDNRALRLSYAPMLLGERLVIRLHHHYAHIAKPEEWICADKPGLTIVYGVTGSGKTTRVYQWLDQACKEMSVVAIEDPPETMSILWPQFDRAICANDPEIHHLVLRQNPDILFWGEMRDSFAWRCVENWVTTGLHVVTTLHASDEKQCMDRLGILGADTDFLSRYLLHMEYCSRESMVV